jgi:hypothetical protein
MLGAVKVGSGDIALPRSGRRPPRTWNQRNRPAGHAGTAGRGGGQIEAWTTPETGTASSRTVANRPWPSTAGRGRTWEIPDQRGGRRGEVETGFVEPQVVRSAPADDAGRVDAVPGKPVDGRRPGEHGHPIAGRKRGDDLAPEPRLGTQVQHAGSDHRGSPFGSRLRCLDGVRWRGRLGRRQRGRRDLDGWRRGLDGRHWECRGRLGCGDDHRGRCPGSGDVGSGCRVGWPWRLRASSRRRLAPPSEPGKPGSPAPRPTMAPVAPPPPSRRYPRRQRRSRSRGRRAGGPAPAW